MNPNANNRTKNVEYSVLLIYVQLLVAGVRFELQIVPPCKTGTRLKVCSLPMAPIEGLIQVQGDITNARTAEVVIRHFDGCKANLVVCDGAPDCENIKRIFAWVYFLLCQDGLTIVTHILRKGGKFIAKIFQGKDTGLLYCQLKLFFSEVTFAKPKSSHNSRMGRGPTGPEGGRWGLNHHWTREHYGADAFVVCENYSPLEGFNEKDLHRLLEKVGSPSGADDLDCSSGWLEGQNKVYIPFLACGDLNGYTSQIVRNHFLKLLVESIRVWILYNLPYHHHTRELLT